MFIMRSGFGEDGWCGLEITFDRGVYLPEADLWLDSLRKQDRGIISHAHSDHTARHHRPVLTENTHRLLSDYLKKSSPTILGYGEPLETDKYTLTLHPAGHCLGSAQVLVQSKFSGERVLYTGDFKAKPSPVNEPLTAVPCDILVIESTYGRPEYTFPPEQQVLETAYKTLRTWMSRGECAVVMGWRLGKSQELLHHLLSEGFEAVVEQSVYKVVETYQEAGVTFPGKFQPFDGTWPEGTVLICPPGRWSSNELRGFRHKRFMELTGWATGGYRGWGRRGDSSLPFSDHADFNELVGYVRQVGPKQVYTVNGFPELADHLRELGYPAVHLDRKGQRVTPGFQMKML